MSRSDRLGYGFAIATLLQWAGFIVISRWGGRTGLTPFDVAALRIGTAALALSPWWLPRLLNPELRRLPLYQSIVFAALAGITYPLAAYCGFYLAPGIHAAVLISGLLPAFTALSAWWLLREVPTATRWVSIFLIVSGVSVVLGSAPLPLNTAFGDVLLIVAAAAWSLFATLLKRWNVRSFDVTLGAVCFSALTYLPVYALLLPKAVSQVPLSSVVFIAVFHGIGVVCVAMWTYGRAVELIGPTRMALMMSIVPAVGTLLTVLILGESWTVGTATGLAIASLGTLVNALIPRWQNRHRTSSLTNPPGNPQSIAPAK